MGESELRTAPPRADYGIIKPPRHSANGRDSVTGETKVEDMALMAGGARQRLEI